MNPTGKSVASSVSLNNYEFDFGLSTNQARSMNDQKNRSSISSSPSMFSSQTRPTTTAPSWQPNKPSWTQKPLSNPPASMVGDISGKSWSTATPSSQNIGIVNRNPNLFEDLVSLGMGEHKSKSNVSLKSVAPLSNTSYHIPNYSDSIGNKSSTSTNLYNNNSHNTRLTPNLGGPAMRSMGGGGGLSVTGDPLSSLNVLGSKKVPTMNNKSSNNASEDDAFGDFLNASNTHRSAHTASVDPLDMLFSSSTSKDPVKEDLFEENGTEEFSRGITGDGATDLEGLPAPPLGVSPSSALNKGLESKKQGQHAEAIKWLSWAVKLLEKAGDISSFTEALTSRASCYKEVGEYKKAVADCTKVLENDHENVTVLVQRALLYESMEKYKLGAEDLRAVMKLDPGNRVAKSTIHRLTKMAE